MNIILIHGEDSTQGSLRLDELKDSARTKGLQIVTVEADSGKSLEETLSAGSLFDKHRLFVLENPGRLAKRDLDWLGKQGKNVQEALVLYSKGELRKEFLKKLPPGSKIELFKLPESLYQFLDSFYPGNSKKTLQILHQLIRTQPIEKIVYFLALRVRDLYWVTQDAQLLPYKEDWRILKILSQSKKFEKGKLLAVIADLAEADVVSKTSDNPMIGLLDQIIATQLE